MRYVFLFSISQLFNLSFAQERATITTNSEYRQTQTEAAEKAIIELRTGALLVRLNFKLQEIAYYEKYQNFKEANKIKANALKTNTVIMDAFAKNFDFCPVYFFSMHDSRRILEGKLDSVIFYNTDGVPDTSIHMGAPAYLIAEFDAIEQDTTYYYKGTLNDATKEDNIAQNKTYYGGDKYTISALVIRNRDFNQLRDPFPYYVKYAPNALIARRYILPVIKMNNKLKSYSGSPAE